MAIELDNEEGIIEFTVKGHDEPIILDLYESYNESLGILNDKDVPEPVRNRLWVDWLKKKGFPDTLTHRAAERIWAAIYNRVQELKKADQG